MRPMDLIATTTRIASLARSGSISIARELFDGMVERDVVAWNAMLAGYSRAGQPLEALSLISAMRFSGARPDAFSFTGAVAAAADLRDLRVGRKLHGLVLRAGFGSCLPVSNSLVDMYGKCSCLLDAARVFEGMEKRNDVSWCSLLHGYVNSGLLDGARDLFVEMPVRSTIAWNTIIVGYARFGQPSLSLKFFKEMQSFGLEGDFSTFATVMNACSEQPDDLCLGWMIHAFIIRRGWASAVEVGNSILSFYSSCGCVNDAIMIFESMEVRSLVSWNAMIDAHMRIGNMESAQFLFKSMPETNIISWTAMIGGFARNGHGEEALMLFLDMTRKQLRPDDFTFGAVLLVCASLTVKEIGRMVHACVILMGFHSYVYVCNGLVDMYAKCGDISCSNKVFDSIMNRDLVSWNAMLLGFATHGWASRALELFKTLLAENVMPDKHTFVGLLMACSHAGLIDQGRALFENMESVHGLAPDADHVNCVIDMLGRAGHVREVNKLLEDLSEIMDETNINSCESLLSASTVCGDACSWRRVGVELVSSEPQRDVGYVMLSNLYCISGQWREAEVVRRKMVQQGVKKEPGCSWIEVRERVMLFVSGIQSLGGMIDAYEMILLLESEMRNPSFFGVYRPLMF